MVEHACFQKAHSNGAAQPADTRVTQLLCRQWIANQRGGAREVGHDGALHVGREQHHPRVDEPSRPADTTGAEEESRAGEVARPSCPVHRWISRTSSALTAPLGVTPAAAGSATGRRPVLHTCCLWHWRKPVTGRFQSWRVKQKLHWVTSAYCPCVRWVETSQGRIPETIWRWTGVGHIMPASGALWEVGTCGVWLVSCWRASLGRRASARRTSR